MACNNSSNKDDQSDKPQKISASIHFDNVSKKSLEQNWWHKDIKFRQSMLAQKEYTNATTQQIDNLEKLLAKIKKDPGGVLSMVLYIRSIYTKYLNKVNKANKKRNEIRICALRLEQELHISNEERDQEVFFLQ